MKLSRWQILRVLLVNTEQDKKIAVRGLCEQTSVSGSSVFPIAVAVTNLRYILAGCKT
jgi:hypothetical protein